MAAPLSILAAVAILALLLASLFFCAAAPAAAAGDLVVTMDTFLTDVGESAALTASGDAVATLRPDATLHLRIAGPAALSQIRESSAALPVAAGFSVTAGSLPGTARPGPDQIRLPLPAAILPASPGAYRVSLEVRSEGAVVAAGSTWMGRVDRSTAGTTLDVAFVWRAELGIHRDHQGRFIDAVIDEACGAGGALTGLAGLSARYPSWRFSLGIEPVLLTQLRDMADGFTRADGSGAGLTVSADDTAAAGARSVLTALAASVDAGTVEFAAGPYAGADLGLLATQDWRDGFEQIQLGKQELAQTLVLGLPPSGAYSPGLDLTGGSLGDYGRASIDHVLVDATVARGLNEEVPEHVPAVRAHDEANDRVTLVLADTGLRALVVAPWDASSLFAGIAAALAAGERDALVLTQGADFDLPPQAYLDAVGEELQKASWIRTQTMSDLLKSHPPGTRPLLLTRGPAPPTGYIAPTILAAVQEAHAAVDELAAAADPASLTLEAARRSLYLAQSRWWTRQGVSPEEASAGLAYAVEAKTIARGTLGKVSLTEVRGAVVWGRAGTVTVAARNDAEGAMTMELRLTGDGLTFPGGATTRVRLEPGGNTLTVPVEGASSARVLTARLAAGPTVVAEKTASLHFVTVVDVLPWAGLAVLVIVLAVLIMMLVRKDGRRRPRGGGAASGRRR